MRNGNYFFLISISPPISMFLSYLWGMETSSTKRSIISWTSSYPTYEEWKQEESIRVTVGNNEFLSYLWGMETKQCIRRIQIKARQFLSYLWGMETQFLLEKAGFVGCSYPTYEEWKLEYSNGYCFLIGNVLILPMRNGNKSSLYSKPSNISVLILPMRNGNHWRNSILSEKSNRSYPTYEEWKLWFLIGKIKGAKMFLSYLWGMETLFLIILKDSPHGCSYPTYEEWKHSSLFEKWFHLL